MLTYNSDTSDGLTNGSTGTVHGFERNSANKISVIFVAFDDLSSGSKAKTSMSSQQREQHPGCVPIKIHKFDYSLGKLSKGHTAKATVYQFPITLAWALTAHKCQGLTIKKPQMLSADLDSVFTTGQAYVILGRVQELEQLSLLSFSEKCIKVNAKAKIEAEQIAKNSVCSKLTPWTTRLSKAVKIAVMNIRSLVKHMADLRVDHNILQADIICLCETNLGTDISTIPYQLENYLSFFCSIGKSADVAMYVKNDTVEVLDCSCIAMKNYQIIQIVTKYFDLCVAYRSPNNTVCYTTFLSDILSKIHSDKATFVCGDFNFPDPKNPFMQQMFKSGFEQIVPFPTHIGGNILDQFYYNCVSFKIIELFLHSVYYSDHDAVCVTLQYS